MSPLENVCPECLGAYGTHSDSCPLRPVIDYPQKYPEHYEKSKEDPQDNETSDNDGTSKSEH